MNQIVLHKPIVRYICLFLFLSYSGNAALSNSLMLPIKQFFSEEEKIREHEPALIHKMEKGSEVVYLFEQLSKPSLELFDNSVERFQQITGFVSLSLNDKNQVELVTTPEISEKDLSFLLLVSARMYGYIGYQIA